MCWWCRIVLIVSLGLVGVRADAEEYVFTPVADNTCQRDWNDLCGDSGNDDARDVMTCATRASINRYGRPVLRFDMAAVPPGTPVFSAKLRLWAVLQNEYSSNDHHAARITENWTSTELTWCRRTATAMWATPGVTVTTDGMATTAIPSKFGEDPPPDGTFYPYEEWIEWDVTEIVRAWVEGGMPNFGLRIAQTDLYGHGRNQTIDFASREYSDPNLRPQLVIETCADGATYPVCRTLDTAVQLFAARYSKDAAGFGTPGDPVVYDSTRVTITRSPGNRFFVSGEVAALAPWICDDRLYIDGVYLPPVGFDGILDPSFPLCRPMGEIVGPVAAREVTEFIPEGTHCVTFSLADTQREIYGNTDIYLIKEAGPIAVQPTSWGAVKARYR